VLEVGEEALIIVSPIGGVMMRRRLEERVRIEVSNACPTLP
jgi:putative aminopeptidase FrvX